MDFGDEVDGTVIREILNRAIGGWGMLTPPVDLARRYDMDPSYESLEERIDSLIAWETSKAFSSGFATSLGGPVTLPIALPASLIGGWVIQARLAGTIAVLYGHDLDDDRVRTFVMLALLADSAKEVFREFATLAGRAVAAKGLAAIPRRLLARVNRAIGARLVTKAGQRGVLRLSRIVPVVGGLAGGTVDALACAAVGRMARKLFAPRARPLGAIYTILVDA